MSLAWPSLVFSSHSKESGTLTISTVPTRLLHLHREPCEGQEGYRFDVPVRKDWRIWHQLLQLITDGSWATDEGKV